MVSGILSGSVSSEVISDIPFTLAGKKLPPKETWLPVLWSVCLKRCSDNAQPLLKVVSVYELIFIMGAGTAGYAGIGAGIGAGVGAVVSGATAAGGAAVGAGIGAAFMPVAVCLAVVVGGVKIVADWLMTKEKPQKKPKND